MVAGNYFDVLGVRPHLGRMLTPDDDRDLNGHPVAVLQYDFWQSQYQGRPNVVGEAIRLNGAPFTVVGIAAAGFEGTDVGNPIEDLRAGDDAADDRADQPAARRRAGGVVLSVRAPEAGSDASRRRKRR